MSTAATTTTTFDSSGLSWSEISVRSRRSPPHSQSLKQRIQQARLRKLHALKGADSLYQTALWTTLSHLDELTVEHIRELPDKILKDVCKEALRINGCIDLHVWKVLKCVPAAAQYVSKHFAKEEEEETLRMLERVALLSTPSSNPLAWVVNLELHGVRAYPGEILTLQHIPNLVSLVVTGHPFDTSTHLLNDYLLRSCGRIAFEGYGFARLGVLEVKGLPGITHKSLLYLNAFPCLWLFATNNEWRLDRSRGPAGWQCAKGWAPLTAAKSNKSRQTPSGEQPFPDNVYGKLEYSAGIRVTTIEEEETEVVTGFTCLVGGYWKDPETRRAVGLRDEHNSHTTPATTKTRKMRKLGHDTSLVEMLT